MVAIFRGMPFGIDLALELPKSCLLVERRDPKRLAPLNRGGRHGGSANHGNGGNGR